MMNLKEFASSVKSKVPVGTVLENPRRGTSTILSYDGDRVCYERGHSRFYIDLAELGEAVEHFKGQYVTTAALKEFKPGVYDSSQRGHNCNCTLLFLLLREVGTIRKIQGTGKSGDPFGMQL
jgi:hypothetical protein